MRERSVASACRSRFSLRRAPPVSLTPIRPARSSAPCPLFPPSLPSSSSAPFRSAPPLSSPPRFCFSRLPSCFVPAPCPSALGCRLLPLPSALTPALFTPLPAFLLSLPRISGPLLFASPLPRPHILPSRLPPPPPRFLPAASSAPCPSAPRPPPRPFLTSPRLFRPHPTPPPVPRSASSAPRRASSPPAAPLPHFAPAPFAPSILPLPHSAASPPPSPPSAVERRGLLPFPRLFVRAFW